MAMDGTPHSAESVPAMAAIPPGMRVYAIGDIHGHADLLDMMHEGIAQDLDRRPVEHSVIVYLGDYVDRGPDSAGVIERLRHTRLGNERIMLRGNHEQVLRAFVADPLVMLHWQAFGGIETLTSYGIAPPGVLNDAAFRQMHRAFLDALPPEHLAFLDSLSDQAVIGDYFFCHAGVRPGVPLDRQAPEDLLWIREPFLSSRADFGKVVVHGHTPVPLPERRRNQINVDTGAFRTGRLTAAIIEGTEVGFMQARR